MDRSTNSAKKPVILFDEIEESRSRSHSKLERPDGHGGMANAKGQRLSLRQKVLIFTTNKGQEFIGPLGELPPKIPHSIVKIRKFKRNSPAAARISSKASR